MVIPIFIIVHDRVTVLKKCVESFEKHIKTPIKIIFHDVASTYPECLEYLDQMKKAGHRVYRSEVNNHHTVCNSIEDYLARHPDCHYYALTDPDIELDGIKGDILEYYKWLIDTRGQNLVVGPMLRIDDLPDHYPKKRAVIKSHTEQFWRHKGQTIKWQEGEVQIQRCPIDTTFQLVHRNHPHLRKFPRPGIRTYAPYEARHLDWYLDPDNLTPDQIYYSDKASKIAHWGRNISNPNRVS